MNKVIQTSINNSVVVKETDNRIVEVISTGKQGISGKSAYTIATENGFSGTEEEWLLSLKGNPFTYSDFTPEQLTGLTGPRGATGYTYTPKVDIDGNISWTNNGNLINPTTVNIKGPKGNKGDTGLTGPKGETGFYFEPHIDNYYNLSWTNNGGLENPELINIKGPKGDKGNTGTAATISIGTVSTGEAGTSVSVTNSGSNNAAVLDFIIPKGDKGDKGDPFKIIKVYESIDNMNSDYNNPDISIGSFVIIETGDVNNSDNSKLFVKTDSEYSFVTDLSGSQGIVGPQGPQGIQGPIGVTGPQGESAIISAVNATIDNNVGTPSVTVDLGGTELNRTFTFNFKNIKGEQGIQGIQGPKGETGSQGLKGEKGDTGEKGDQGLKGNDGVNATITNVTASVDNNVGTPSVIVSMGGTSSARTFNFSFKNLKGSKGDTGEKGLKGDTGIQGPKGDKGPKGNQGIQGPQGLKGDRGISVTNAEINFNNGHLILTLE